MQCKLPPQPMHQNLHFNFFKGLVPRLARLVVSFWDETTYTVHIHLLQHLFPSIIIKSIEDNVRPSFTTLHTVTNVLWNHLPQKPVHNSQWCNITKQEMKSMQGYIPAITKKIVARLKNQLTFSQSAYSGCHCPFTNLRCQKPSQYLILLC